MTSILDHIDERACLARELIAALVEQGIIQRESARLRAAFDLDEKAYLREVTKMANTPLTRQQRTLTTSLRQQKEGRATELASSVAEKERRVAGIVNAAFELTQAEVELMWATAPPRMPVSME